MKRSLLVLGAACSALVLGCEASSAPDPVPISRPSQKAAAEIPNKPARAPEPDDTERVAELFASQQGDAWVELDAVVVKQLPDDNKGSRHQRFLIRLRNGQTVLVAHNIDLSTKVPLERGDTVRLRGEYEYNDKGGVLHWTHHDPQGRRRGGWIELAGRRYK